MDINETLLSVIDELYAGALDPARMSSSLDGMARVIGASGGLAYLVEDEHRMIYTAVSNFDLGPPSLLDTQHANMLMGYYRRIPVGSVVHVHSFWPIDQMVKSSYYQNVLKGQDVMYGAASLVLRTARHQGILTLNRSAHGGPFAEDDFRVLRLLGPHLNRVMQITVEMNAIARERETFAAMLDVLSIGVVVTDSRGKALHLNAVAERIIASNDGLSIKKGHLVAEAHDETRVLERLVGHAAGACKPESLERGGTCKVSRSSGPMPWLLLVAPCSDVQARAFAPLLPACVILIRDPSRRQPDMGSVLRQMFDLTPQEARVTLRISEGHGLARVGEEMGLSTLTVRNHLQRVFAKTGTSRQAELSRFVSALAI